SLIKTPVILGVVKDELGLKDSLSELKGEITPSNENSSQLIRITVETSNAKQTTKIANKTADVFHQQIKNYLNVKSAKVVERAQYGQETQILHSRTKANITMGVIIGIVLGMVLTFLMSTLGHRKVQV